MIMDAAVKACSLNVMRVAKRRLGSVDIVRLLGGREAEEIRLGGTNCNYLLAHDRLFDYMTAIYRKSLDQILGRDQVKSIKNEDGW